MPRVVLVDHAAENLASLDRQVQRRAGLAVVVRWSFLAGLVRPVAQPITVPTEDSTPGRVPDRRQLTGDHDHPRGRS